VYSLFNQFRKRRQGIFLEGNYFLIQDGPVLHEAPAPCMMCCFCAISRLSALLAQVPLFRVGLEYEMCLGEDSRLSREEETVVEGEGTTLMKA